MIKPSVEQSCNTHACSVTKCREANCFYAASYHDCGTQCDIYRSYWFYALVWNNKVLCSCEDCSSKCRSVNYNGYRYTASGYCVTQTPL